METRRLRVWEGERRGANIVRFGIRAEYEGPYIEHFTPRKPNKLCPDPGTRDGVIFDRVRNRCACFRESLPFRASAPPTDIVVGMDASHTSECVLDFWDAEPTFRNPRLPAFPCFVTNFTEREPTQEERLIAIPIKPEAGPKSSLRPKPPPQQTPTASPTRELESEIICILNGEMPPTKARPTYSEFYQEQVINRRSMRELACSSHWCERTLKDRKARIEDYLSQKLKMRVDLNTLRTARRKSGRLVYTDPAVIERTFGNNMRHDED